VKLNEGRIVKIKGSWPISHQATASRSALVTECTPRRASSQAKTPQVRKGSALDATIALVSDF
jgi:hypothetical protein